MSLLFVCLPFVFRINGGGTTNEWHIGNAMECDASFTTQILSIWQIHFPDISKNEAKSKNPF